MIKRYTPYVGDNHNNEVMREQQNGFWVRHADYAALEAECERLREIADAQTYDLMGVVADVEQGKGFDEICLATIKSAVAELSKARKEKE